MDENFEIYEEDDVLEPFDPYRSVPLNIVYSLPNGVEEEGTITPTVLQIAFGVLDTALNLSDDPDTRIAQVDKHLGASLLLAQRGDPEALIVSHFAVVLLMQWRDFKLDGDELVDFVGKSDVVVSLTGHENPYTRIELRNR